MENQGRVVCNELKAIRKKIAEVNDIEYTPNECTHQGECAGTCPACEAELKYLEKQLSMRQLIGKAAVVAGLGITVATAVGCSSLKGYQIKGTVPYQHPIPEDSVEVSLRSVDGDGDMDSYMVEATSSEGSTFDKVKVKAKDAS